MNNEKQYNLYSILSIIFGSLSIMNPLNLILSILGIVFSSIAKKENSYDKLAKIGFSLSIISLIIAIIFTIIFAILLIYRVIFINIK